MNKPVLFLNRNGVRGFAESFTLKDSLNSLVVPKTFIIHADNISM